MLTWIHLGDLHVSHEDEYLGARRLADWTTQASRYFRSGIDFVFLPGDNANNGTAEQYARINTALAELELPVFGIPGDHDFEPGDLQAFSRMTGALPLPHAVTIGGHRCLFLDVVSAGGGGPDFRLGAAQLEWVKAQLAAVRRDRRRPVVFMHAYPGDLADEGEGLGQLFQQERVAVVDTGHTHYNELLNDGKVIYAATRSTAQVEEDAGMHGVSVVAVDGPHVSWRFKPDASGWPFVLITCPSDRRLATGEHAAAAVRAKVFGERICMVTLSINGGPALVMDQDEWDATVWTAQLPEDLSAEGAILEVAATDDAGGNGVDRIEWGGSSFRAVSLATALPGTDAHAVNAWPEHGVFGTQLGPNKHGRKW